MPSLQFEGQMAAGFRYDFNASLDEPLALPIRLERLERRIANDFANSLDRLDDIIQSRNQGVSCH